MTQPSVTASGSPLMTINETADHLRVCRRMVFRLLPELESVKIGGKRLVFRTSVDAYIASKRQKVA